MNEVDECNVLAVIAAASVLERLKKEKEESIMLVTGGVKNRSRHDADTMQYFATCRLTA